MWAGTAVNKSFKKFDFTTCVKLGVVSGSGSVSIIEIRIRIRIGMKKMPIHNTAFHPV